MKSVLIVRRRKIVRPRMDVNAASATATVVVLVASLLGYQTVEPPASIHDDEPSAGQNQPPFAQWWSLLGGPACSLLCGFLVACIARGAAPTKCDAASQTAEGWRSDGTTPLAAAPRSAREHFRFETPPRPTKGGRQDDEDGQSSVGSSLFSDTRPTQTTSVASSAATPWHGSSIPSSSSHRRRVPAAAAILASPLNTSLRNRSR